MTRGHFLLAASVLLFIAEFHWRPASMTVAAEVQTDAAVHLTLVHKRYNEADKESMTKVIDTHGRFETVRFPLDRDQLRRFRIVQQPPAEPLRLRNLRIERLAGAPFRVTAEQLQSGDPDQALVASGDDAEIQPGRRSLRLYLDCELPRAIPRTLLATAINWLPALFLCAVCVALVRGGEASRIWKPQLSLRAVVVGLIALYLVTSAAGINGSSSALWRFYVDREDPANAVVFGTPKYIRSDEWLVQTCWILSQAPHVPAFPLVNRAISDIAATLITSVPVKHWSMAFRPQFLPFFFLPPEIGFSFYWNFKWCAFWIGGLLFFYELTSRHLLLAIAGTAFVFFSGFTQWWFSSPTSLPKMLAMFFFAGWAV
ncbi:MAG: hypothetical protein M3032_12950, partial [Verrucomicrobiota bacterium]|nr:hypothetical protein [Verrucomicrobiota bacterium]